MAVVSGRPNFGVNGLYIDAQAADDEISLRLISRLPFLTPVIRDVSEFGDPLRHSDLSDADRIEQGKKNLLLTHYKGKWLKPCPGTLNHLCCNLLVLNLVEGCLFDCSYCALQSYLSRNPTLKLYTNVTQMFELVEKELVSFAGKQVRICTGELSDSLVFDPWTDMSLELVPFFSRFPNVTLELKTKDNFIDNLLLIPSSRHSRTIVSWSVNAETICKNEEHYAPSLDQRIEAASKSAHYGYRIGFHFDPLVLFPGWQDEYRDVIRKIFANISPKQIAWISIAALRYPKAQQEIMLKRFPKSPLPYSEMFLADDKKLRIYQPLRMKLLSFMYRELKQVSSSLPVYLCMESPAVWGMTGASCAMASGELKEIFRK